MNDNSNMMIAFDKKLGREIFNNKVYPLGTTFTFIINHLSYLAYNTKFKLESYKNIDLLDAFFKARDKLKDERISFIKQTNIHSNEKYITDLDIHTIEIEGISLSNNEFKELTLFIFHFDEFFDIVKENESLMKLETFLYFFSTLYDYNIPTCKIIFKDNDNKFIESKQEFFDLINKNYDYIKKMDSQALKKIIKPNNFLYVYNCNNFIDVLLASLKYIIEQKIKLKQCELCSNFFIASHDNKRFCDNIRPQYQDEDICKYNSNKLTCSQYNKKYLSYQNMNKEKKAIRKITSNIRKRIKNKTEDPAYLEKWKKSVDRKKEEVKKQYITDDKFIDWIENKSDYNGRKQNVRSRNNKK